MGHPLHLRWAAVPGVVGEPFDDVAAKLAKMTLRKLGDRAAEPAEEHASTRLIVRGSTDPSVTHEDAVLRSLEASAASDG